MNKANALFLKSEKKFIFKSENIRNQMFLQILVLIIFFSSGFGIIFFFHVKNSAVKESHLKTLVSLKNAISINSEQIKIRNSGMDRYSFLEYNLSDSMVIQPKIVLY